MPAGGGAQLNDGGSRATSQILLLVALDVVVVVMLLLLLMMQMLHLAAAPHNARRVLVELHGGRRTRVQRVLGLQRILPRSAVLLVAVDHPVQIRSLLVQAAQIQLLLVLLRIAAAVVFVAASDLGQILLAATDEIHDRGTLEAAHILIDIEESSTI